jgi:hypothetical protein
MVSSAVLQSAKGRAAWYSEAAKLFSHPHACQIVGLEELQAAFEGRKALWVPLHQLQSHISLWKASPLSAVAFTDVESLVSDIEANLAGLSANQRQHPVAALLRDDLAVWKALMPTLKVRHLHFLC